MNESITLVVIRHRRPPREIQEIVCSTALILLLSLYYCSTTNPFQLFHRARIVIRLMAWLHSLFTNRMTMPFNVTGFEADQPLTMPFL